MLQDLAFGHLDNQFKDHAPAAGDVVVCVQGGGILIARDKNDVLTLPAFEQVEQWSEHWTHWHERPFRYAFTMQDVRYFLWMGDGGQPGDPSFAYEPASSLRQVVSKHICFAAMTAWHIYNWYKSSRFCGCCAAPTVHDKKERMVRCPRCGNTIYPRINPAVIVGVTDGDRLLLTQYAGRGYTHYALIAGFTEIGETLEQTVQREVMEEVGLKVKNIRYYKSQPWGIDGNILVGFYCDLDGDDTIHLDEKELALAEWHMRGSRPAKDDNFTITREMIRVFDEGKEPR